MAQILIASFAIILIFLLLSFGIQRFLDISVDIRKEETGRRGIILTEMILSRSKLLWQPEYKAHKTIYKGAFNATKLREILNYLKKHEFSPDLHREFIGDFYYPGSVLIFSIEDLENKKTYGPFFLTSNNDMEKYKNVISCLVERFQDPESMKDTRSVKSIVSECYGSGASDFWIYLKFPCVIKDGYLSRECFMNSLFIDLSFYEVLKTTEELGGIHP